jgi:hypothetical protein
MQQKHHTSLFYPFAAMNATQPTDVWLANRLLRSHAPLARLRASKALEAGPLLFAAAVRSGGGRELKKGGRQFG